MATTTVLYLGFSFTDAYLDELRSEILALLAYEGGDRPIAYALLNDATPDEVDYARRHEGIEILSFPSDPDYRGFDDTLAVIHELTNPTRTLGRLLHGKRIVWIDPASDLVGPGMEFLEQAASSSGADATIDRFDNVDEALDSIEADGTDLVVTRWGHGRAPGGGSTAEHVLGEVRRRNLHAPVLVFASGDHADENKRTAMGLGATSSEFTWEGLFQEVERIFRPGSGSEAPAPLPSALLFVWNPTEANSWDDFEEAVAATADGRTKTVAWKAGTRKHFEIGERVFLFRTRQDRGIVASGVIASDVFEQEHYDGSGTIVPFVKIRFDNVVRDELPVNVLTAEVRSNDWNSLYGSGRRITEDIDVIEALWAEHLQSLDDGSNQPERPSS